MFSRVREWFRGDSTERAFQFGVDNDGNEISIDAVIEELGDDFSPTYKAILRENWRERKEIEKGSEEGKKLLEQGRFVFERIAGVENWEEFYKRVILDGLKDMRKRGLVKTKTLSKAAELIQKYDFILPIHTVQEHRPGSRNLAASNGEGAFIKVNVLLPEGKVLEAWGKKFAAKKDYEVSEAVDSTLKDSGVSGFLPNSYTLKDDEGKKYIAIGPFIDGDLLGEELTGKDVVSRVVALRRPLEDLVEAAVFGTNNKRKFKRGLFGDYVLDEQNDHTEMFFNKFVYRARPEIRKKQSNGLVPDIKNLREVVAKQLGRPLDNQKRYFTHGDSHAWNRAGQYWIDWELARFAPILRDVYWLLDKAGLRAHPEKEEQALRIVYDKLKVLDTKLGKSFDDFRKDYFEVVRPFEDFLWAARYLEFSKEPKRIMADTEEESDRKREGYEKLAQLYYNWGLRGANEELRDCVRDFAGKHLPSEFAEIDDEELKSMVKDIDILHQKSKTPIVKSFSEGYDPIGAIEQILERPKRRRSRLGIGAVALAGLTFLGLGVGGLIGSLVNAEKTQTKAVVAEDHYFVEPNKRISFGRAYELFNLGYEMSQRDSGGGNLDRMIEMHKNSLERVWFEERMKIYETLFAFTPDDHRLTKDEKKEVRNLVTNLRKTEKKTEDLGYTSLFMVTLEGQAWGGELGWYVRDALAKDRESAENPWDAIEQRYHEMIPFVIRSIIKATLYHKDEVMDYNAHNDERIVSIFTEEDEDTGLKRSAERVIEYWKPGHREDGIAGVIGLYLGLDTRRTMGSSGAIAWLRSAKKREKYDNPGGRLKIKIFERALYELPIVAAEWENSHNRRPR